MISANDDNLPTNDKIFELLQLGGIEPHQLEPVTGTKLYDSLFHSLSVMNTTVKKVSSETAEEKFVLAWSVGINADYSFASIAWKRYLEAQDANQILQTTNLYSLKSMEGFRMFYLEQRKYSWMILQEIIRFSDDCDNIYNEMALRIVENLVQTKHLMDTITEHLVNLYNWKNFILDDTLYRNIDDCAKLSSSQFKQEFAQFTRSNSVHMAAFISKEVEYCLETLILLNYARDRITPQQLNCLLKTGKDRQLLPPKVSFDILLLPSSHEVIPRKALNELVVRIQVGYVMLLACCLKFLLFLDSPGEASALHPLLLNFEDKRILVKNDIAEIGECLSGTSTACAVAMITARAQHLDEQCNAACNALLYLWGSFLQLIKRPISGQLVSRHALQWVGDRGDALVDMALKRDGGALSDLSRLLLLRFGPVTHSKSFGQGLVEAGDRALNCAIMFEVLNMTIVHAFNHNDFSEIDSIVDLVELIMTHQESLCEMFWDKWEELNEHVSEYPLCQLVLLLVDMRIQSCSPSHLLRVLKSLSSTGGHGGTVVSILNKEIRMIGTVDTGFVYFSSSVVCADGSATSSPWQDVTSWRQSMHGKASTSTRVKLAVSPMTSQPRIPYQSHRMPLLGEAAVQSLCVASPPVGCDGDLREMRDDWRQCEVAWDKNTRWWGVILDIVTMAYFQHGLALGTSEGVSRALAAVCLLSTLVEEEAMLTSLNLADMWDQILLKSLLQSLNMTEYLDTVFNAHETLASIIARPEQALRVLVDEIGLPEAQVRIIVNGALALQLDQSSFRFSSSIEAFASCISGIAHQIATACTKGEMTCCEDAVWLLIACMKLLSALSRCPGDWALAVVQASVTTFAMHDRKLNSLLTMINVLCDELHGSLATMAMSSALKIQACLLCHSLLEILTLPQSFNKLQLLFSNSEGMQLSRSEFVNVMQASGRSVTPAAVDILYHEMGCHGAARLSYGTLSRYAQRLERKSETMSESQPALRDLHGYLLNMTTLSGKAFENLVVSCAPIMMDYVADSLISINQGSECHENSLALANTCLKLLQNVISMSSREWKNSKNRRCVALHHFTRRLLSSDGRLSLAIVQFSTMLSLSAVNDHLTTTLGSATLHHHVKFSDFMDKGPQGEYMDGVAPLPVCFSQGILSSNVRELAVEVTQLALHLSSVLMAFVAQDLNKSEFLSAMSPWHQPICVPPWISTGEVMANATATGHFKCTYITLLCGLIDFPQSSSVSLSAMKLLSMIITRMTAASHEFSLSAHLLQSNIEPFVTSLAMCIHENRCLGMPREALCLLANICQHQPITFAQLSSVQCKQGWNEAHAVNSRMSFVGDVIAYHLTEIKNVYHRDPGQVLGLLVLVKTMLKSSLQNCVTRTNILTILSKPGTIDALSFPLMEDIPEYDSSSACDIVEARTEEHCLQLLTHSVALDILSEELHGTILIMNEKFGKVVAQKVHSFLTHATEKHRFGYWLKHYVDAKVCSDLFATTSQEFLLVGLNIADFAKPDANHTNISFDTMQFGNNYIFDLDLIQLLSSRVDTNQASASGDVDISEQWTNVTTVLARLNCNLSVSDAQLAVLSSWRKFLQIYVIPGSRTRLLREVKFVGETATSELSSHSSSSESPPVSPRGSVSPSTGSSFGNAPPSPSLAHPSTFVGDKRSYEIVTRIMASLLAEESDTLAPADDLLCSLISSLNNQSRAIVEKCDLLVSMLHHQLMIVHSRTLDAAMSQVDARDSSRLSLSKKASLLTDLVQFYHKFVKHSKLDPNARLIQLRLLTAMLLVMSNTPVTEFSDHSTQLKQWEIDCFEIFNISFEVILTEHKRGGDSAFCRPTGQKTAKGAINAEYFHHKTSGVEEQELSGTAGTSVAQAALAETAVRLILESFTTAPTSPAALTHWQRVLVSCGFAEAMVQLFGRLASVSAGLVEKQHNYDHWRADVTASWQSGCVYAHPNYHDQDGDVGVFDGPVETGASPVASMLDGTQVLCSILDILTRAVSSSMVTVDMLLQAGLFSVIGSSQLFMDYQQFLSTQSPRKTRVLSSYRSDTGDQSAVAECWLRMVALTTCVLRAITLPSATDKVLQEVSRFMNCCSGLLLLPLHLGTDCRISLLQASLATATLSMFVYANRNCPAWQSLAPSVHAAVCVAVTSAMQLLCDLLWEGDEFKEEAAQRQKIRLFNHVIVVSLKERKEIESHSSLKGGKGFTKLSNDPMSLYRKQSSHLASASAPVTGSCPQAGEDSSGLPSELREFLENIECSLIACFVQVSIFMNDATPAPLEGLRCLDNDQFKICVGCRVIFCKQVLGTRASIAGSVSSNSMSPGSGHTAGIIGNMEVMKEGIITAVHGQFCEVLTATGALEGAVHVNDIRSTSIPNFAFLQTRELSRAVDPALGTAMTTAPSSVLSTAQLLQAALYAASADTARRLRAEGSDRAAVACDLRVLACVLSSLLLGNLDHHSRFVLNGHLYGSPVTVLGAQMTALGQLLTRGTQAAASSPAPLWMQSASWQQHAQQSLDDLCHVMRTVGLVLDLASSPPASFSPRDTSSFATPSGRGGMASPLRILDSSPAGKAFEQRSTGPSPAGDSTLATPKSTRKSKSRTPINWINTVEEL